MVLALVVLAGLILTLWRPVQQMGAVAAVQDSVDRGWEISYGAAWRPESLPEYWDDKVGEWFYELFKDKHGYGSGTGGPKGRNVDHIYHDRFRSLFRRPIEVIKIGYPEGFHGDDLGGALARFPKLRTFEVFENEEDVPKEADWIKLCARLLRLPELETIDLGGNQLTDRAIAELAGHPGLRVVSISNCRLTTACTETFATMPALKELYLDKGLPDDPSKAEPWEFTQKDRDTVTAALPKVRVEFGSPP
jgi:hypothetical protein